MDNKLREGYTTGSCAAAGAAAAACFLQEKVSIEAVYIDTPGGKRLRIATRLTEHGQDFAEFGVIKDAGDDPDCTHGLEVRTRVAFLPEDGDIVFRAGQGVGTVSKAGLKIPPGQPAINPMPRAMITSEIRKYFPSRAAIVTVSIPGGEKIAQKTFNPRLGIVNGLSVLGTSGIVRPMSSEALIESIYAELSVKAADSTAHVILTFGGMGESALQKAGCDRQRMVQASNYIGLALDKAVSLGFSDIMIGGHAGKLIKIAAGIFMTHSAIADARVEIICCHAALEGADKQTLQAVFEAPTTQAADEILRAAGLRQAVWQRIAQEAAVRASQRAAMSVRCVMLDDEGLVIGRSQ